MASLAQMSQILDKTEASLSSYAKVFNNTSEEIIKDTEAMGSSALALRDQVNSLIRDAQGLKKMGITLDRNNTQQVEDYILKIKELDNVVSNIAPSIGANLKALNINIEKEFRIADGINEETGKVKYTAGYLKEELNDLASVFRESSLRENVEGLAPNLLGFADNFVKEVDKIEYQMGRITEFGNLRSESEKALGFTVERRDIDDIISKRQQELEEFNITAMDYGYSSYREEDFLALFPEIREQIETTDNYIKQLEGSIGKYITGYIEMFNSALDLSKSGQSYQPMFEAIGGGMANMLYGEQDWNSMTPAKFKKLEEGEDDYEIDGWDEFNSSSKETEKVATQVEETVSSASKAIDNSGESLEKATKSTRNYTEELNKLLQSNNLLSEEQTQGILGKDYSSQIKRYKDNLEFIKQDLKSFGDIKLTDKAEVKLDSSNTSDATKLLGYTSRVEEDLEKLKELTKQRDTLFNNLNNPEYVNKTSTNPISKEYLNDIKSTLESGYKVNLLDGSSDKEKLDKLREGYLQLIDSFKNHEVSAITDKEIEDLNKLNTLQKAISDETQRQTNIAKAKEDYEKDRIKYAEQYNKLAQANLNIDTLRADRDRLAEKANSRKEHTRYEDIFNSKTGLYEKKEIKYSDRDIIKEQYNKEISKLNNERNSLEKSINSLKDKFEKSGLEVPVVPTLKLSPKLGTEFKKNRLGLLKEDLNNTLGEGGIGKYKDTLSNITKQADELGINISKSLGRVNAIGNTIKTAFNSGDIEKAKGLVEVYGNEIDKLNNKVLGQAKAQNIAKEKQREAQTKLYREALDYQSNQASIGNKISDKDYVNYLRQQAEEYKRLGGSVEKYQRLITKANELEKKTYEDGLKAAKDKVNGVLSTVKSLADGVNNAVNKVISIIRQGIQIITRVINGAIKFVSNIGRTITNIIKLFGNLGNRIRQVFNGGAGSANIFKSSITELNSKLTLLKNAFNAVFNNQFIAKGKNLLTSISTLNVVMGTELTDNTIKWAQELEGALGISATDLIADLKEVSAVLKGLGMESQDVYVGARNLGMMSRYLGMMGLAGGNVDQVMSKLTSGMKGMTAAIDRNIIYV